MLLHAREREKRGGRGAAGARRALKRTRERRREGGGEGRRAERKSRKREREREGEEKKARKKGTRRASRVSCHLRRTGGSLAYYATQSVSFPPSLIPFRSLARSIPFFSLFLLRFSVPSRSRAGLRTAKVSSSVRLLALNSSTSPLDSVSPRKRRKCSGASEGERKRRWKIETKSEREKENVVRAHAYTSYIYKVYTYTYTHRAARRETKGREREEGRGRRTGKEREREAGRKRSPRNSTGAIEVSGERQK